ncbi:MAG: hypothetical protein IPG96_21245 [Proteobacteria bacterium]|nr:hypothetical protein [Pseudomonadota bacterium]
MSQRTSKTSSAGERGRRAAVLARGPFTALLLLTGLALGLALPLPAGAAGGTLTSPVAELWSVPRKQPAQGRAFVLALTIPSGFHRNTLSGLDHVVQRAVGHYGKDLVLGGVTAPGSGLTAALSGAIRGGEALYRPTRFLVLADPPARAQPCRAYGAAMIGVDQQRPLSVETLFDLLGRLPPDDPRRDFFDANVLAALKARYGRQPNLAEIVSLHANRRWHRAAGERDATLSPLPFHSGFLQALLLHQMVGALPLIGLDPRAAPPHPIVAQTMPGVRVEKFAAYGFAAPPELSRLPDPRVRTLAEEPGKHAAALAEGAGYTALLESPLSAFTELIRRRVGVPVMAGAIAFIAPVDLDALADVLKGRRSIADLARALRR